MKKIIIRYLIVLPLTILLSTNGLFAQEQKLDSTRTFTWDTPNVPSDWFMQGREHYSYANGGTKETNIINLYRFDTNSIWINNTQIIKTYNAENQLEIEIFQLWNSTSWENFNQTENLYDGSGNNNITNRYSYDGANWVRTFQDQKTYNVDNLLEEAITKTDAGGMLINFRRIVNNYTGALLMVSSTYNWETIDWAATPVRRTTYNYIGDQLDDYTSEEDEGSGLEQKFYVKNTYMNDKLTTQTSQKWDSSISEFVDDLQQTISYDMNGLFNEVILYKSVGPGLWLPQNKLVYFWSEASLSTKVQNIYETRLYPNPFSGHFTISFPTTLESKSHMTIYDNLGKSITSVDLKAGTKTVNFSNPNLKPGLYFVNITNAIESKTFKTIKE